MEVLKQLHLIAQFFAEKEEEKDILLFIIQLKKLLILKILIIQIFNIIKNKDIIFILTIKKLLKNLILI